MLNNLKQMEIKKILYGLGLVTLVLMAILFLISDNGSEYKQNYSIQSGAIDSLNTKTSQSPSPSMSGYLLKVILVTIFIIAILILGAKWFGKLNKFSGNPAFIKILSKQNIGPKQFLLLIVLEKKKLLLGVTENSINHIADMGEYNESDDVEYNSIKETTSFSSLLNYLRKGKNE